MRLLVTMVLLCWTACMRSDVEHAADARVVGDGVAVDASSSLGWQLVSVGRLHACGIRLDGSLWCWGRNDVGQLGIANTFEADKRQRVGSSSWKTVVTAFDTTCGIQTDNSLWCWGANDHGQIGDGTTTNASSPVRVGSDTFIAVGTGASHTCAVRSDAAALCWGGNAEGQLGVGTTSGSLVPIRVASTTKFMTIATGAAHSCAIASSGAVWCWGSNQQGQLGCAPDPAATRLEPMRVPARQALVSRVPKLIPDLMLTSITAGDQHTCGRTFEGQLRCWGSDENFQLGISATTRESTCLPTRVHGDTGQFVSAEAGSQQTCARTIDNRVLCWGDNRWSQLALDNKLPHVWPSTELPGTWAYVSSGTYSTCAIDTQANLQCVGIDAFGSLGNGAGATRVPTEIPITATTFSNVRAGEATVCAMGSPGGGGLLCWGANDRGQVGNASTQDRRSPFWVGGSFWTEIDPSVTHTCGIATGGLLLCWGDNSHGQICGDASSLTPRQIGSGFMHVATGAAHTCATKSDQSLWCWGGNGSGQLGLGDVASRAAPTLVGMQWTAIAGGGAHSCGVRSGNLSCWGERTRGQLGDGSTSVNQLTPTTTAIAATTTVSGYDHTCALAGSTASCWGRGTEGELGNATAVDSATPATLTNTWLELAAGRDHSCGIATDRTLWCWGSGAYGQLGTGVLEVTTAPKRVGTSSEWWHITAGDRFTCGVTTNWRLFCWGLNDRGQLGIGRGIQPSFVLVP
jgi:alpha-tubulin suppressor-like RCC1 family protein